VIQIHHTDLDPDTYHDTDKTCLGGGMHCPSASSFCYALVSTTTYLLSCVVYW